MECDPESTSVTIKFFFQSLTQQIITHLQWNFGKNLWSGSVYIKLSTKVFTIVILNVTIFVLRPRNVVISNFVIQLLRLLRVKGLYIFSSPSRSKENTEDFKIPYECQS